jgi:glycosyltransferase involved in cell wall biosynthesis
MKVLFDASVVAEGFVHNERRAGIFRVAHDLAVALGARSDISLSLSAARSWQASYDISALSQAGRFGSTDVITADPGRAPMAVISAMHSAARSGLPVVEKAAVIRARTLDRIVPPLRPQDVDRFDVFHLPAHWIPAFPRGRARYVVSIYDIIADTNPEFGNQWSRDAYAQLRRRLDPKDFIVTDSEWVKSEIVAHWGVSPERIISAPLAARRDLFFPVNEGSRQRTLERLGVGDRKFILGADRADTRKNVRMLVRAFVQAAATGTIEGTSLVLIGEHHWDPASVFTTAGDKHIARERIARLGYVADNDLASLYSAATAFVFPSLLEGFGLPALEAMQCGTPVITSNTSSLPEVVGAAAIMVDPQSVDALADAMKRMVSDHALRAHLAERSVQQAARFTWERTADRVVESYHAALSR